MRKNAGGGWQNFPSGMTFWFRKKRRDKVE